MTYKPTRLSAEAFQELRAIVESEIMDPMPSKEVEEMGIEVLKLFSILLTPQSKPTGIQPTEQERKNEVA